MPASRGGVVDQGQQRGLAEAVAKLTGVVTALEVQSQALLLAAVRAGAHPDLVLRALRDVPRPVLPPSARDAYERAMAGFERRLDEAALEALAPDPRRSSEEGRESGPQAGGDHPFLVRSVDARRRALPWLAVPLALMVALAAAAWLATGERLLLDGGPSAAAPVQGTRLDPDPP
jgi:hypothetical protein